jgi:pyridinium-3,5-bisthiocarboxylic acid mononucleotide nickel chelatase
MEMRRDIVTAETEFGKICLKVSTDDSGAQTVSPEFEDCRRLATSHDVALKDVMTAAIVAFHGRNTSGDASD